MSRKERNYTIQIAKIEEEAKKTAEKADTKKTIFSKRTQGLTGIPTGPRS